MQKLWYIQQLDLFKDLPQNILNEVDSLMSMRDYCKKELIFGPGDRDRVFIVKTGRVELYQLSPEGKKVIIEVLKLGSVFGDLGLETPYETFVAATIDSCVCSLKKDTFFSFVSRHPKVSERLMKNLFNRIIAVENRVSSLAVDNAFQRFIKLLLQLGKSDKNDSIEVSDTFTHEEFAQMLGISRQTVTTLINQLERKKLITRSKKRLWFKKSQLQQLVS